MRRCGSISYKANSNPLTAGTIRQSPSTFFAKIVLPAPIKAILVIHIFLSP
ncbi:hypothetical protein CHCC14427_3491 [Bacillus paralicheniformis]|nr:hypothetical protein CHCC14427_3491 [Bacillus paralicheniformis]